jgi:hypothetical protein
MPGSEQDAHHALAPQSHSMADRYIKTVKEHLRKVVASHQREWDVRLPIFLLLTGHPHSLNHNNVKKSICHITSGSY